MVEHSYSSHPWITFIGIVLLLIGIFASVRTLYNTTMMAYPQSGVLYFNMSGMAPYYQRASDCIQNQPYYGADGAVRESNAEEKKQQMLTQENCLKGVADAQHQAKTNDIGTSVFFLFLGVGVLLSRRFIR